MSRSPRPPRPIRRWTRSFAKVCFIFGDIRAANPEEKLEAYDQGREAALHAVNLAPNNAETHFWHGTNTARWGQTKDSRRARELLESIKGKS